MVDENAEQLTPEEEEDIRQQMLVACALFEMIELRFPPNVIKPYNTFHGVAFLIGTLIGFSPSKWQIAFLREMMDSVNDGIENGEEALKESAMREKTDAPPH